MRRWGGRGGRRDGSTTRRGPARLAAVAVAGLVLAVLTGCGTPAEPGPRFVTPPLIRYSTVLWPVPLELVGAEPGVRLRLRATVTTAHGTWDSSATYTVPASGTLDLARARPQLAAYTQPDSAGLFWSLRGPQLSASDLQDQWMLGDIPVSLTASDGDRIVAERIFRLQGLGTDLHPREVSVHDLVGGRSGFPPQQTHEDGPVGTYWSAASLDRPATPVVVMFEDPSEGASAAFTAPLLVEFGASVFAIPLEGAPDGVRLRSVVDSSTIGAVLAWLGGRPDVLRNHIFVYGTGAAAQLAVWAANRFPSSFAGLFAAAGSPALLCLPDSGIAPAFEGGASLPCRTAANTVSPSALLALNGMDGPVVVSCGTRDTVLPSACAWQQTLAAARLPRDGDAVLTAPDAGHAVTVPPGLPIALDLGAGPGASEQATEKARIAFWNAVGQTILRAVLS